MFHYFKDKHKLLEVKLEFKGHNYMFNSYEMELYSAPADRHPEGGAVVQSPASSGPEAVGAAGGDAAALSQGPGEQRLLQLLVPQQAAQGAPHPSLGG